MADQKENKTRLVAWIIRELKRQGKTFETLADWVDAIKFRLAARGVPWTNNDISAALALVQSNTELVPAPKTLKRVLGPGPVPELPIINRNDVARIYAMIAAESRRRTRT